MHDGSLAEAAGCLESALALVPRNASAVAALGRVLRRMEDWERLAVLLAAEAHGYQTSPMAGFDEGAVKALLGLPPASRVVALVAVGRGAEEGREHHRHALDRLVRYV